MRRQFVLVTLAITSMIVVAFVLPLAFLIRTIAADRATSRASADAQQVGQIIAGNRAIAPGLVAQADASSPGRVSVYYADGSVVGDNDAAPGHRQPRTGAAGPVVQSLDRRRCRRVPARARRQGTDGGGPGECFPR